MDFIIPSENDTISNATPSKPLGFGSQKKGLSMTTPNNRLKLGNLSNTANLNSRHKSILNQDDDGKCCSIKKPSLVQSVNINNKPSKLLPIEEEIENYYPNDPKDYRDFHHPSEIHDFYVQFMHPQILSAPYDSEDEDDKAKEKILEMAIDDFIDEFF